jgi:hypothetical protein
MRKDMTAALKEDREVSYRRAWRKMPQGKGMPKVPGEVN